ncbi:CRISPR-associated endonuclease/helicase Cas3 [Tulasnella sp. 418]|nr:CRISPR-associated endonuclease/helicase Cas3 [Tulasnella sp. 418]
MTCALEHIDANSDLILMEMSINDTTQPVFMEAFEWLVRRLLRLPNRPAIIDTQILALSFDQILMGGDVHMGITQYYDIPTVSLKNVIAGHIMRDAQLEHDFFENPQQGVDLRHMNVNGHRMLGELLVSYVRRQICDEARYKLLYDSMERSDSMARLLPSIDTVEELPKMRLYSKYHANETAPDLNPTCMSMNSKKNPLKPVSTTGWVEWSWKDKPYLIAKNPGDKVTFEIRIDSLGSVTMSYLRSKTFGLGKLKCWLDNDVAKAKVLSGYWTYDKLNLVRDDYIVVGGSPGKHLLNCEILKETDDPKGGHEFRIVAITTT